MSEQVTDDKRQSGPKVYLCDLWRRTSKRGTTYYSGYLAGAKVIGFEEVLADKEQPVIRLYVTEGDRPPPEVQRKEPAGR